MSKAVFAVILIILFIPAPLISADNIARSLAGYILLQVEANGEAWYVDPNNHLRHFLGRPNDAWKIMRAQGEGILDMDLVRIPIGITQEDKDADNDGLGDGLEKAIGSNTDAPDTDGDGLSDREEIIKNYNPSGPEVLPVDLEFAHRQRGRIFIQVERNGEAWYISPLDAKRYYLDRPADAFSIIRTLGRGISNADLGQIALDVSETGTKEASPLEETILAVSIDVLEPTEYLDFSRIEFTIQERINHQRLNQGLKPFIWNAQLAGVAREHSLNLAGENELTTQIGRSCDYPLIHHEDLDFGLYNSDRLKNRGVLYFSKAGENIALVSSADITVGLIADDPAQLEIEACPENREEWDVSFRQALDLTTDDARPAIINSEINLRQAALEAASQLEVSSIDWRTEDAIAQDIVRGWMESEGHRKNLLDPEYDEGGVGVAYVNSYVIATQTYIKRASCGYETGSCCTQAGYFNYCFVPLSCNQSICGAN